MDSGIPFLHPRSPYNMPMAMTGLLSFKEGDRYYSLHFQDLGWMAADMIQYLDDLLKARDRPAGILKLLGLTMQISSKRPPRRGDHWVIVDLKGRRIQTNSDLIRMAVEQQTPTKSSPYSELALRRIYQTLDRNDFTVSFFS